jgi:nitrite reductase (NADH) small subunit
MSEWIEVVEMNQIPVLGSRVIRTDEMDIALFRGSDDRVYAVRDACPHKNGPLSQGIMHGHSVTCPLHNWKIDLTNGEALGPDEGCTNVFPVKVEEGMVLLQLSRNEAAA